MIEKVLLKDRDTGQTLETFMFNRASSASGDTYDFEMDVSSYFVTATTKRFQLIAYDDAGNTGKIRYMTDRLTTGCMIIFIKRIFRILLVV